MNNCTPRGLFSPGNPKQTKETEQYSRSHLRVMKILLISRRQAAYKQNFCMSHPPGRPKGGHGTKSDFVIISAACQPFPQEERGKKKSRNWPDVSVCVQIIPGVFTVFSLDDEKHCCNSHLSSPACPCSK